MQSILGVFFHFLGGFASGSFYIPFKKVKGWAWESYWIVGGFFSWLIIPFIAAFLTIDNFGDIISSQAGSTLFMVYFFGLLWGIGGLTFGLAMRYLGMSLGMSVALGFCSAFGAMIPPIYRQFFSPESANTISALFHSNGGLYVFGGIAVCLAGIYICGKAGMMKEKELSDDQKKETIAEFNIF